MQKKSKIIFFGDSITELGVNENGFITLMKKKLSIENKQEFQLIGSGIGGNKVYDLFFRMEKDILEQKPNVVVIWIGVNDVWHKTSAGTGTDADKFEKFYDAIVKKLQNSGIEVFCCTPACIGEKTDFSNQQDGDLNHYSKIIRQIAAKNKVGLIDIRQAFLDWNKKNNRENLYHSILTNDGVHLNDAGNKLVAELMWKTLIEKQ
jgi:lysophospholipase L1-like esterase